MNIRSTYRAGRGRRTGIGLAVAGILLLITGCRGPRPVAELSENDRYRSLEHDGYNRTYLVHRPAVHAGEPGRPLLLVLHGGGGNAKRMLQLTRNRFSEIADSVGFYVVYPEGIRNQWNDQRSEPISYAHRMHIDDVGFLENVIDRMIKEYAVDPGRVFVTGISNGGVMSYRLAAELPDRITAIAPVTANLPVEGRGTLGEIGTGGVSLMVLNGTEDPLVRYGGGEIKMLWNRRGRMISTAETVGIWVERLGCERSPAETLLPDRDPGDGTRVHRVEHRSCRNGARVILYEIRGGGHTWPGGWQYLPEQMVGRTSRDINAGDEIWTFFSGLP